jgi:hypothetical protein
VLLVISTSISLKPFLERTEARQHLVRPIEEDLVGRPYLLAIAGQADIRTVLALKAQDHDTVGDQLAKLAAG